MCRRGYRIMVPLLLLAFVTETFAVSHFGTWMSLGLQSSNHFPNEALLLGTTMPLCQSIGGLSAGQQKLCMLYTDHMMHVGRGAKKGISECQYQFKDHKWNCTTVNDTTVFGEILDIPSKESAFANAIAAAGVVHSVSRGCRDGQLNSCGCSDSRRPKELKKEWNWGGCGDNIHYGYKFARHFIDVREREKNEVRGSQEHARQLMNMHNSEAGRRAVIKNMKVTCKCHGVSGSCSLVTCWQQLSPFRQVGDFLEDQYKGATRVKVTRKGRLRLRRSSSKVPTANDLVFLNRSPDYCTRNETIGTPGTHGRTCDPHGRGQSSCSQMCCGRGYDLINTTVKERCHCKFHWCCFVKCQTCSKKVDLAVCK